MMNNSGIIIISLLHLLTSTMIVPQSKSSGERFTSAESIQQ
jgi:hypothetical protein